MKFTLVCYLPSILLIGLALLGSHSPDMRRDEALISGFGALLLIPATFAVGVYWLVRLVRRAWRDGSTPPAAPADTGRIFGRLS